MKKVAKFEKVSFAQFEKDFQSLFEGNYDIKEIYDKLKLPARGTRFSAGYDFFSPIAFTLAPNQTITIPTGIRAKIEDFYFLQIFPRSSLGFKFRLQLNNTVGIIDSDYYNAQNEGHILIKLTNASNENKTAEVLQGQGLAQGIFTEFGITIDDNASGERIGGFGSTNK
ncbi:MAG: deoxyuridine 5'-triphosphate nucleotidohydrolase [Clostridia bacterium]|nr:deoxyuridine 5'-triphosphate nucleotidohydrolase [Clostridia bacterium]